MVQAKLKMLSADNHIVEPPDLWTSRIDARFRDRAPRIERGETADWYVIEGDKSMGSLGTATHAGDRYTAERPDEIPLEDRWENVRPGGYEPDEAIKDMDIDGVEGAVLFPTRGVGGIWRLEDSELLSAICRTYNDWIAEFCKAYPQRLLGAAMINLDNVQEGVEELRRAKNLGLGAAIISVHPPPSQGYHLPGYEPLWAAAEELDIPLCMHSGSNRSVHDGIPMYHHDQDHAPDEPLEIVYINGDHWIRRSLTSMILSGVFERHPELKVVSVENQAGWVAHWLYRMDLRYESRKTSWGRYETDMKPSDFFHRNVSVTFQDDWTGIAMRSLIGVDNLLWGSDYPHTESTWPESQRVVREIFEDVPEEDLRKITYLNTARVFGFSG
jgi:predicted TIM-barrel fold metal-dependent hydrolase